MFGLLKHRKLDEEQYSDFRLNYCGTCKTIGKLYGQKERLFLNYDIVFLSELLSSIKNCPEDFNYIKPYTCLTLPKHVKDIPEYLQYTASINILLGNYKILDNVVDSKFKLNVWRGLKNLFDTNFRKAKLYLSNKEFPIELIEESIDEQFRREKSRISFEKIEDTIRYYSSPTSQITENVFRHGVIANNDEILSGLMAEIGSKFGEIIYLIDAIEDYSSDKKSGNFNLFLTHDQSNEVGIIEKGKEYIYTNLQIIEKNLNKLPISNIKKKAFVSNLYLNVNAKISDKKCCSIPKKQPIKRLSVRERYDYAIAKAKHISFGKKNVAYKYTSFTFSVAFFLLIFLLFPHLIYSASDYPYKADCCQDCGEFNCSKCGDGHCCADCCEWCCCDQCCSECCDCPSSQYDRRSCRDMGDTCQEMPCCGCCGLALLIGVCGGCAGAAAEAPKVIIKVITAPVRGCCG